MSHNPMFFMILMGLMSTVFYNEVQAACTQTITAQTEDSYTAKIIFGKTNLPSIHLVPNGSVLDTVSVPPTAYNFGGAHAESELWRCDKSDLGQIHFLAATNGDDRLGGFWDIGGADGLQDVYATYFANIGLHQSMNGVSLTRYWKEIPITNYDEENGKIIIRLKHLPTLQATTYRLSTQPPSSGAASSYCGNGTLPTTGNYICNQPSAYIQLSGTSQVTMTNFYRDMAGEDSAYNIDFWGSDNGFGYGMNTTANSLTRIPACVIRQVHPLITFPNISAQALNGGTSTGAIFPVRVECENIAKSGTASGQVALGFQASEHSYQVTTDLGFVNSSGGAKYVVSDDYGRDDSLASGVGIELSNPDGNKAMLFLSPNATTGGGENKGWYPVLEGMTHPYDEVQDHFQVSKMYRVSLTALPGQKATAGKVKATVNIQVKVQ